MTDHDAKRPELHLGAPPISIPEGAAVGTSTTDLPFTANRSFSPGRFHAASAVIAAVVLVVTGLGVANAVSSSSSSSDGWAAMAPSTTASRPTAPSTMPPAVATTQPPAAQIPVEQLPRHEAVYRDGKLILQGTVPTVAIRARFQREAAAVVGASNVLVRYKIDPRVAVPTDGRVRVDDSILFARGSAVITSTYELILQLGIKVMQLNPSARMRVVGYTDTSGSLALNQKLSQARAEAVRTFISAGGVDPSRIDAVGRGPAAPVASNDTEAGRAKNRRIEVDLLGLLAG